MQADIQLSEDDIERGFNAYVTILTNGEDVIFDCSESCEAEDFRLFTAAIIADLLKEKCENGHNKLSDYNNIIHEVVNAAVDRF